ncbi:MAG: hypothetical protein K6G30_13250 [Acetatifactor sp.]|nr:hypothetical protein [Acetatifactor sp.]
MAEELVSNFDVFLQIKEEHMAKRNRKRPKKRKNHVIRTYKDTVFRMLFTDRKELLELYNAVNDTEYQNPEELIITTLDSAIFMTIKNDVSFVVDMRLGLYEQQSTVNPNMPLRNLLYVSQVYEELVVRTDLYSRKRIMLPAPHFITFYNGEEIQGEYFFTDSGGTGSGRVYCGGNSGRISAQRESEGDQYEYFI